MKLVTRTIAAPDGADLATDIYLPVGRRPRGCLVQRTPYGRRSGLALTTLGIHRAVDSGFAVAIQDVRGRGDSDGEFRPFDSEGRDGAAAIGELAAWIGAPVVTYGASYSGYLQFLTAAHSPDGLVGMVPFISSSTLHDEWIWRGDAINLGFLMTWVFQSLVLDAPGSSGPRGRALDAIRSALDGYPATLAYDPRVLAELAADGGAPYLRDWLTAGPHDPEWACYRTDTLMRTSHVPVYTVGGWFDLFQSGSPRQFRHLVETSPDLPHESVVGPWAHSVPFGPSAGTTWFGHANSSGAWGLEPRILAWVSDRIDAAIGSARASVFDLGTKAWTTTGGFADVPRRTLPFRRRGAKSAGAALTSAGGDSVRLFGGRGSATANVHLSSGMHVQPPAGRGMVDFEGPQLDPGTTVTGPIELHISLASRERDFHVAAALLLERDGVLRNVSDGYLSGSAEPSATCSLQVDLGETLLTLAEGDRLILRVMGSNWPTMERPPSTTNVIDIADEVLIEFGLLEHAVSPMV